MQVNEFVGQKAKGRLVDILVHTPIAICVFSLWLLLLLNCGLSLLTHIGAKE
jgi:hypothetical protein